MQTNNFPKVTIVTPTFNLIKNKRVEMFDNIIDIVSRQTYPNIEHLIIDGGSTDGTLDILKEKASQKKIYFYSEADSGVYDAFNKGLAKASGEYIAYMGSDDVYYNQDSIKLLIDAIVAVQADWAYGDTLYQTADNELWFWKGTLNSLPFGSGPCHQSMLVSTAIMKEIGGFELNNAVADIDVMLKLFHKRYPCVYVSEVISIFRAGGWSTQAGGNLLKESFLKSFYGIFGNELKLSAKECESLYAGECFGILSAEENIALGLKLSYPEWVKTFFSRDWCILKSPNSNIIQNIPENKKRKFYFLGCPILKICQNSDKVEVYLCGLKVFCQKQKLGRISCKVFGIPFLKIKEKRTF